MVCEKLLIIVSLYDRLMTKVVKVVKSLRIGLSGNSSSDVIKLKKNIHTIAVGIQGMQERCVYMSPECAGLSTGDLHEEDYHPSRGQAYRYRGCCRLRLVSVAGRSQREQGYAGLDAEKRRHYAKRLQRVHGGY
jgi:hypothetical protein